MDVDREGYDYYIPVKHAIKKPIPARTTSRPVRSSRKDYKEVEVISDASDQEEVQGVVDLGEVDR